MVVLVEILTSTKQSSPTAAIMLRALVQAAQSHGDTVIEPTQYVGKGEWLVLYGVGAADRNIARRAHVLSGRRAILWDLGYFRREKITGHLRCSIDHDHPQRWLDDTPSDPSRWNQLGINLREVANPDGPIILVGLGAKSREYLQDPDWEVRKYHWIRRMFGNARIIYRPKPGHKVPLLPGPVRIIDDTTPIERLLEGCSLVVCRHSNVAVDAAIAGVPIHVEDGAAKWLANKPYTRENRFDFLCRLSWWQWRANEATLAWKFLREVVK